MAIYIKLGCERCREQASFIRSGSAGCGWLHSAQEVLPTFVERHEDHVDQLRVYTEIDPRYKAFSDWEQAANIQSKPA